MTYESYETSVETSQPVELYTVTLGSTVWYYTSGALAVTIGGTTWEPLAGLSRTAQPQSQEDQDQQVEITLPASTPVVRFFIASVPGQSVEIVVERIQILDVTEARMVMYSGLVQSVTFEDGGTKAVLSVVTSQSAFSKAVPRDVYSAVCNHVLFDDRCGLAEASWRVTAEVLSIVGNVIEIDGLSSEADGYYTAGFIELTGSAPDFRVILAHATDFVTVALPFGTSPLGELVRVYAGCAHDPTTCQAKFNNLINFGGFPFVPTKNPFQTGLK